MSTFLASVALREAATFEATSGSGHTVILDSAEVTGGGNNGPCPLELLLMGVGGCAGMVTIGILRRMHQDVSAYRVDVQGTRAETHPKVYTAMTVEHVLEGRNLDRVMVRQALTLAASKYCPVVVMVGQTVPITHTYRLLDLATGKEQVGWLEECP
jgi:putative redox protein